ncbi:serine/threonine-protein kinase [Micromonospora sp. SH-82]|uniref:serine/threonine-protein kinase n=1 Tax=Micromonospora sp. SH-82 TaxID=3132938 RepID=UPI003EBD9861
MLSSEVVLSGRYRLDERVATGGMGDVWCAMDLVLGRQVAVKVLLPGLVSDPDFIARFRAEARIMAALRHPGIVQVYDSGEDTLTDGGRADYLVMEYVEGQPLSKQIEAAGRLDVDETLSVVNQAAQALHAAHNGGIVHRDVKPSNLLVQADGTVVLVDFGVARSTNVTSITSTNAVPGTALYMAPEQAAGRPVTGATDIYALGAVAYCCLTGAPPFTGDNPLQVAVRHLDDEPPPLPEEIPAPVRALVLRALAKDPAERFATGAEMAEAARAALSGDGDATAVAGVAAYRPRDPDPTRAVPPVGAAVATGGRGRRRGRGPLVGAAVVVLVALGGLGAALGMTGQTGDADRGVEIRDTTPAAVPTTEDQPSVEPETTPSEESRPNRPANPTNRSSGSPSPSPSPSASPSEDTEPSPSPVRPSATTETPTPTAPATTPPPTTGAPVDPPPPTTGPPDTDPGGPAVGE